MPGWDAGTAAGKQIIQQLGLDPVEMLLAMTTGPGRSVGKALLPPVQKGFMRLFRGESHAAPKGPSWVKEHLNLPEHAAQKNAAGRWFTHDPEIASWYVKDAGTSGKLMYVDVPVEVAEAARVTKQAADVAKYSLDPVNEFFLPAEFAAKKIPVP